MAVDHDRLFKELLTTFFVEFVELFLPDVAAYLDRDSLEFLDKEVFTDVTAGEKHEVDLLVKAKVRGKDTFFLFHVENQAKPQPGFPKRMFVYFARLHEKYDLPIYPVVIFSYDAPRRAEPKQYQVAFPGKSVLDFRYTVIQLNRLNWRDYVRNPNPVASALMAKMRIAPKDRPKVKLECLRMLTTLRLNKAKARLISGFVDNYLRLNAQEQRMFEREVAVLPSEEQEPIMELTTSWMEEGLAKGRVEGSQTEALMYTERLLKRKFGRITSSLQSQIAQLSASKLEDLGVALFDFATIAEVEVWLKTQSSR